MREFVLSNTGGVQKDIDFEKELNDEQLAVVEGGDGPCLVLAGAGSGKTRTITFRVAYLLSKGVDPSSILLVTFTNKAAREMVERIEQIFGYYPNGLWAGTFHSIANRLLRKYADRIGYTSSFSILSQDDAQELIGLSVKELKIDTKKKRFPSNSVLMSMISLARNKDVALEEVLEWQHPKFLPILDEIQAVADKYEVQKKWQNVMDFDDLLINLRNLLRDDEEIGKQLSNQFAYILVDEFQDTNTIQADIVSRLAKVHGNILVVGDDAQSIYSFRAAEIQNILDFPNQYSEAKKFALTKNYRSTPEILNIANAVIAFNEGQFHKELQAEVSSGEKPLLVPAPSVHKEAHFIADQILDLHGGGMPLSEMAVLFRASFHSQALEFELMKRDIPYEYRGGMKFFERSHVKDVIAHVRILNNVRDGMAWVRALRIHPGIGLVTAGKIANQASQVDHAAQVLDFANPAGKRGYAGWQSFRNILSAVTTVAELPSQIIRALITTNEYKAYLENEFPNYRERLEDLEQFAIFAEQFDDLDAFLDAVSLTDEFGLKHSNEPVNNEDRVVLSTIHQAKGLEWSAVFVMRLTEGSFPNSRSVNDEAAIEEERRLFYVAVTRARRKLFLTYPATAGFDHVELQQPSMFLEEIPNNAIEEVRLRTQPGFSVNHGRTARRGGDNKPNVAFTDDGFFEEESISYDAPSEFLKKID